jgi:serine/threonine-protein kinase
MRRLTQSTSADQYGLWTPDGSRIVFQSDLKQTPGIYISRADGIGEPQLILERAAAFPNAVTPDGKSVVFRATSTATKNDLFVVPMDGPDRKVTTLIQTPQNELNGALSPDGKWIAFESDVSGRSEVYVRPFPDVNRGQDLISTAGGTEPAWSPNGHELFYLGADNKMYSVAVKFGATGEASFSAPVALFDASRFFFGGLGRNYDVTVDGKRFVMVKSEESRAGSADPLRVILHWTERLKRGK